MPRLSLHGWSAEQKRERKNQMVAQWRLLHPDKQRLYRARWLAKARQGAKQKVSVPANS